MKKSKSVMSTVGFPPAETWSELSSRLHWAVIMMIAPVFSGEYEGVDNIILTSKYGKTKCAAAKVIASILTAILATALVAAVNLLLALAFYGTDGLDCSILFAPSDYVEAFIPFNITCGTLLQYQILLAFTCTLSVTGMTLLLSAISKNQIVALVAAMAMFLFPFCCDHRSKSTVSTGRTSSNLSRTGRFSSVGGTNAQRVCCMRYGLSRQRCSFWELGQVPRAAYLQTSGFISH